MTGRAVHMFSSLASAIFNPGMPYLTIDSGSTSIALAGFVSAYIVHFVFAPLLFAPLGELYGRNIIMHSSNVSSGRS